MNSYNPRDFKKYLGKTIITLPIQEAWGQMIYCINLDGTYELYEGFKCDRSLMDGGRIVALAGLKPKLKKTFQNIFSDKYFHTQASNFESRFLARQLDSISFLEEYGQPAEKGLLLVLCGEIKLDVCPEKRIAPALITGGIQNIQ